MYEHHGHHSHCPRYRRSSAIMTTSGIKDSPMRRLFYLIDITVIGLLYFALDAATNAFAFSRNFRVDGSNLVQLTGDDADHEDPAWSPGGTRIAFVLSP